MPVDGAIDLGLAIWSSLVTNMPPADLPHGVSPDCADIVFTPGSVKTRPGTLSYLSAPISGNPQIYYLKTYTDPVGNDRLLYFDGTELWQEYPRGTYTNISLSGIGVGISAGLMPHAKSVSAFTREYGCISDGIKGCFPPWQWDGTNFDRVTQDGPGAAPSVTDYLTPAYNLQDSPGGILPIPGVTSAAVTQNGNTATLTLSDTFADIFGANLGSNGIIVGDEIQYSGDSVAGYNGTWIVTAIIGNNQLQFVPGTTGLAPSGGGTVYFGIAQFLTTVGTGDPTQFPIQGSMLVAGAGTAAYDTTWNVRSAVYGTFLTVTAYAAVFDESNSGGGTIQAGGSITAGTHQLSVMFVTRQGQVTKAAVPVSWVAAGGLKASVTNIPKGPNNVIARLLAFTPMIVPPATTGTFYSIPSTMTVNDNITTSLIVDFTDTNLIAAENLEGQFNLHTLRPCLGVSTYSSRMFWWGELGSIADEFVNLSFDGGWNNNGTGPVPLGWTLDGTYGGGGSKLVGSGLNNGTIANDAYKITSDGSANNGMITQPAYQNYLGTPILGSEIEYSVRFWAYGAGLTQGAIAVEIYSPSLGSLGKYTGASFLSLTNKFQLFTGVLLSARASIPSDAILRLYLSGANSGAYVVIDEVDPFLTNQPINTNFMRASLAFTPEGYDGTTGILQPADQVEQWIRNSFVVRERFHVVKQHSTYLTQDPGNAEPASWTISRLSPRVGTPSIHGVDVAEEWSVIAEESGLYIYYGGQPVKIMQEIQSDPTGLGRECWDAINWTYDQNIWVKIDTANRRILVGAPIGDATSPNLIFVMDYSKLDTADEIASSPPIHMSYTGRPIARDVARKWTKWTVPANYGELTPLQNSTTLESVWAFLMGNQVGDGQIYELSDTAYSNLGATAIDGYYQTYFFPAADEEQALPVGSHRKLFNYLTAFIEGSGSLETTAFLPGNTTAFILSERTLTNPGPDDFEWMTNITTERCSYRLETNSIGSWMLCERLCPSVMPSPTTVVRGSR